MSLSNLMEFKKEVLNEVVDGTFDECFVSLNYLKKKYDSKK